MGCPGKASGWVSDPVLALCPPQASSALTCRLNVGECLPVAVSVFSPVTRRRISGWGEASGIFTEITNRPAFAVKIYMWEGVVINVKSDLMTFLLKISARRWLCPPGEDVL